MTAVVKGDNIGETIYIVVYTSQENIKIVYAPIYIIFSLRLSEKIRDYSFF